MKGIILAGGLGTRLYPVTLAVSKQLLPIYDKPMIYYPLSTLMLAGIRDILIISTSNDVGQFQDLLKDGSHLGLSIQYAVQIEPYGLAHAFILGKSFIKKDSIALVLGDNIFYGNDFIRILQEITPREKGATIFGYRVKDPSRYGVVEFDETCRVIGIEEKPKKPKSNFAVPGLYFYDNQVVSFAEELEPSLRGELEITDINNMYLERGELKVKLLGRGYAWLDTGTFDAFHKASSFVQVIQERQGVKIACIEEIAFRMGYITLDQLDNLNKKYSNNEYGDYLHQLIEMETSLV